MYWISVNIGSIQRADLDGTHLENLVTGLNNSNRIFLFSGRVVKGKQDIPRKTERSRNNSYQYFFTILQSCIYSNL